MHGYDVLATVECCCYARREIPIRLLQNLGKKSKDRQKRDPAEVCLQRKGAQIRRLGVRVPVRWRRKTRRLRQV